MPQKTQIFDGVIIEDIINRVVLLDELSNKALADFCVYANQTYRLGQAIISDEDYDFVYLPQLKKRQPEHPLLTHIETEVMGFSNTKHTLPQAMLSTDKAYLWNEVEKWLVRIEKSAQLINFDLSAINIEVTAKLDGFAGFDDGKRLYTRGDGKKGSDISRVFQRGLSIFNDDKRGLGAGEIVVKKSYFKEKLSHLFEYPRNFQASIIKEKALDKLTQQAITDKAAVFVPFSTLPKWQGSLIQLRQNFSQIVNDSLHSVDFDVDGVVLSVTNQAIKDNMGNTRKFHRWQLAFKENKDKAQVTVLSVTPQVGRTGKITPVVELEPTLLSGATLSRVSAHHYGYIKQEKLGTGSVVELTRSGLVIPKINRVLKASQAQIPSQCPSCHQVLVWQSDFLLCDNHQYCPDQIISSLVFFFAILGNNDGFGSATIKKLYHHNIQTLKAIYALEAKQLMALGFGEKTSNNLVTELQKSKKINIEDWRFLAAFGVVRLGLGNCERLLQHYPLSSLFTLGVAEIAQIEGFAQLSADAIVKGLQAIQIDFNHLLQQGFNLETTSITSQANLGKQDHDFFGKSFVFTGKMQLSRPEMTKQAKALGIKVLKTVSKQCDYLIIGQKVGQNKLNKARQYNAQIISEMAYLKKINHESS